MNSYLYGETYFIDVMGHKLLDGVKVNQGVMLLLFLIIIKSGLIQFILIDHWTELFKIRDSVY